MGFPARQAADGDAQCPVRQAQRDQCLALGQSTVFAIGHAVSGNGPVIDTPIMGSIFHRLEPRKTLAFQTPADRFNACVASTG